MRTLTMIALSIGALLILAACGAREVSQQATSAQFQVRLSLDAAATGSRVAQINVLDRDGRPVVADSVILAPTMGGMGHSLPELVATPEAPGHYRATGELFSMGGLWELAVAVRRGSAAESVCFSIDVAR